MRKFISLALTTLIFCLSACGKYLPPLAPESLAPAAVKTLEVTADLQNVNFKWEASDRNQIGEELKTIEGYRIYRKDLVKPSDLINEEIEYSLLATIEDKHLLELKRLRDEALKENKPTRKVKVDETLKQFTYSDSNVGSGKLYAYQIIPINQDGIEGEANKIVKVLFRGTSSEIIMIDQSRLEVDELE